MAVGDGVAIIDELFSQRGEESGGSDGHTTEIIMGRTSKRLHRQLKAAKSDPGRSGRRGNAVADVPDVAKLIEDGLDPTHAGYVFVQHIASKFAEGASQFPEMRKFAKIVAEAEDEYLPSAPPMSPLTTGFFTSWMLYLHRHDAIFLAGIPDLKATLPHA